MKPKSDNLFHFTKSLAVLKSILKDGFQPRYCLEDVTWMAPELSHLAYAMTCFCDIPLTRIGEHNDFYGNYGIGMAKEWGLRNALEPVIYIRNDGVISSAINFFVDLDRSRDRGLPDEERPDKLEEDEHIFSIIRFIKPTVGTMLVGGKPVQKEFYQENEWRYAPDTTASHVVLTPQNFDVDKDAANRDAVRLSLKFTPQDIKYLFVSSDNEIPGLIDFINSELGHFPANDLKILASRITSLTSIAGDL